MLNSGILTSAFGLPKAKNYKKDGKVYFGYAQPEYKECLAYLNQLYEEGLLDPNFTTIDTETQDANIMNGKSGVTLGALNGGIGNYLRTMKDKGPFHVAGIASLVANEGDKAMSGYYEYPVTGAYAVITPSCKNKKLAAQFLNYNYTKEGSLLNNFGVEGESYTIEDGEPVYTDLITNNPKGLTMQLALAQYARAWANGWFVQDIRYQQQYSSLPEQQDALKNWSKHDGATYQMPPVSIPLDKAAEYSSILSDVNTYVDEMTTKYIIGAESLDSYEKVYLKTLKSMNISRVTDILQDALEEFDSRK